MFVQLHHVHQCFPCWSECLCFYLGIYFAKHAAYADRYSTKSRDPLPLYGGERRGVDCELTKIIFLARVMTGKSRVGEQDFLKPDHGSSENTHDSCVDDVQHPTIFVIFDPNQIYPEYLIQYRWRSTLDTFVYIRRCYTDFSLKTTWINSRNRPKSTCGYSCFNALLSV